MVERGLSMTKVRAYGAMAACGAFEEYEIELPELKNDDVEIRVPCWEPQSLRCGGGLDARFLCSPQHIATNGVVSDVQD